MIDDGKDRYIPGGNTIIKADSIVSEIKPIMRGFGNAINNDDLVPLGQLVGLLITSGILKLVAFTGLINGTNKIFTLSETPVGTSLLVFYNGQKLKEGEGYVMLDPVTVEFSSAPYLSETIEFYANV